MPNIKSLFKDTAIYGLSSIIGRFLNYLLVPLYTHCISAECGGYGVVTNVYAYTALILVILTFGMETTYFRFANKEEENPDTVFSTAFAMVTFLSVLFVGLMTLFIDPVSQWLGYPDHHEYILMMGTVVALDAIQAIPFSLLRYLKRPLKFAGLKLLFIALNIGLNLFYFCWLRKTDVVYIFALNLVCTAIITFFFIPEMLRIRWRVDLRLLRRMFSYSWPILVLGLVGILNQSLDKMIYPKVAPDPVEGQVQLGIYGACFKVAMIMGMITQAFRYAYEPIVFGATREKGTDEERKQYYAKAMKYFIIFTLLAFLTVISFMDILQLIIGAGYRDGLRVVPIVMAAEIMMGIYFNLSFWYKLIDRTIYGAWFSLAGCIVMVCINLWGIPRYGYMACAWAGFCGYATCMLLSYFVGQRQNPFPYDLKSIGSYVLLTAALYVALTQVPDAGVHSKGDLLTGHALLIILIKAAHLLFFVAYLCWKDFPFWRLLRRRK